MEWVKEQQLEEEEECCPICEDVGSVRTQVALSGLCCCDALEVSHRISPAVLWFYCDWRVRVMFVVDLELV